MIPSDTARYGPPPQASRRPRVFSRLTLAAAVLAAPLCAMGYDFVRHTVPQEWIEPHVPEDLPALATPSYYNALDTARAQVASGRPKKALVTLYQARDLDPADAGLVKAQALSALGRYDEALEVLTQPELADVPAAQVLHARVLADLGRTEEALERLRSHLQAHPDSIDGHFLLGQVNEQIGDLPAAREAYAWFVEEQRYLDRWQVENDPVFEDAASVTTIGRAIDRYATITEAYKGNVKLHDTVLNMFVRAYDVIDRDYWPAHVAAAEYFMRFDQDRDAQNELQLALADNPNDLEALRLAGSLAVQTFNFDGAEAAIEAMQLVNPQSIDAKLLQARNLLRQRLPKEAEAPLRAVLDRQPKNLEALGLLAATYALQLREDEAAAVLRQVDSIDIGHDNASAYFEVAEQLGAMRQYPRSAAMYKIAIDRAPWWTAPRNGLGLLYTQSGDEDDARATLEAARMLDPFNMATTNYLRLLDDLDAFAVRETPHFVIYYDEATDPLIPDYFAEYLEWVYPQVTGTFRHEPAVKTFIEVFPSHDGFSVRTTGSPWIGTVGASTGRVIAMVAPRHGKNTMGPYHWAQVLRHEFAHTVTLSATDNRISHWMTEGLAVMEEQTPLKWEWVPMLHEAVTSDTLFTLDNLTWGFVRPRKPTDRALAYAQSFWICQYIANTYGHDALLAMMDGFKAGKSQDQVFPDVLKRSTSEFTEEFFAWTRQEVAAWGYDKETTAKYESLKDQGETLIRTRQYEKAIELWREIAQLRPMDALPHQRLAGLYLRLTQPDKALEHLVALHKVEIKDNRYAKRIARLYREQGDTEQAIQYARESVYIDPYDIDSHELLAELYEAAGDAERAQREQRVVQLLQERATQGTAQ